MFCLGSFGWCEVIVGEGKCAESKKPAYRYKQASD